MLARDYKIRVFLVFACFSCLFVIIAIRLFLIQIRQKDFFKLLAQHQHELEITFNPQRAIIYDASGTTPLAFNREVPSAFLIPEEMVEPKKTLRFLKKHYPDVHERIIQNPDKQFLWLDRKLTPVKYAFLEKAGLNDIHFIGEFQRFYPYPSAAQLIGFTDIDNIGTAGIELEYSRYLGGLPARIKVEKDARSGMLYFEKMIQKKGQKGTPLKLTIDSSLQATVYNELASVVEGFNAKSGSVLILDPETGRIIAMANFPAFDPNQKSIPSLDVMKNNIACECYELGSVMKVFCALAALEENVVRYDEPIDCEGRFGYIDGVKVENPTITLLNKLKETNNILPFCDVIRYSSNVGIAKVAKRLGPKFYTHLRKLGFGSKTGIQFPGERSGFVNPPERWSKPSLIVMSFGYEFMATLLQLADAFCIIANGGYAVKPTLVANNNMNKSKKKLYKDETIQTMRRMLERICERYPIEGFRIMGKTGTARCIKDGKYSTQAHIYTFAGIVEKGSYRRVVVTFIKEPGERAGLWASTVALPLFRSVAERMVIHDRVHHKMI